MRTRLGSLSAVFVSTIAICAQADEPFARFFAAKDLPLLGYSVWAVKPGDKPSVMLLQIREDNIDGQMFETLEGLARSRAVQNIESLSFVDSPHQTQKHIFMETIPFEAPEKMTLVLVSRYGPSTAPAKSATTEEARKVSFAFYQEFTTKGLPELLFRSMAGSSDELDEKSVKCLKDIMERSKRGGYGGIGAHIFKVPSGLRVTKLVPGGGAANAGVQVDDVIETVDGKALADLSAADSVALLRGKAGTTVALTVRRKGSVEKITVTRADVAVTTASVEKYLKAGSPNNRPKTDAGSSSRHQSESATPR